VKENGKQQKTNDRAEQFAASDDKVQHSRNRDLRDDQKKVPQLHVCSTLTVAVGFWIARGRPTSQGEPLRPSDDLQVSVSEAGPKSAPPSS
jgi:hypothetical protein